MNYLQENQTPEWKRAYIDYGACKKAINVVATRLGQAKEKEGKDEDDGGSSSGPDDDNGPTAPPKISPETLKSSSLKSRPNSATFSPRLSRVTSSRSPSARTPGYGSTGESAHPRPFIAPPNPPPLDLGSPGVDDDYAGPSPAKPDDSNSASDHDQLKNRDNHQRRGVAFSPTAEDIGRQNMEELLESPTNSLSSDRDPVIGMNNVESHSTELLKKRPADLQLNTAKNVSSPKVFGRSPRGLFTPRLSAIRSDQTSGLKSGRSFIEQPRSLRSITLPSPALGYRPALTPIRVYNNYDDLYEQCEPDEKAFFDILERELDKVEKFYVSREIEAKKRAHDLRAQLRELAEHRKLYHEIYPEGIPEWETKVGMILPTGTQVRASALSKIHNRLKYVFDGDDSVDKSGTFGADSQEENTYTRTNSPTMDEHKRQNLRQAITDDKDHQTYNPERYRKYKKDLRNALLEFYKQLELVKNYRIMNLTGFRKALKKFEKMSKLHCLELYTDERITKCTFSKSEAIDDLIKQMEELYTSHFEHGDLKKAREKLRRQQHERTHYQSVFKSGIMLGIALPAVIAALCEASRAQTRQEIPGWDGLLQAYGALYLPLIFALLFELNLMAYVTARINYEFVMELTRPTIDYRSFMELPAFLFLTLSYCFYFSFARIGSSNVDPTTWPAAWLVFFAVFWLNPLPILRRRTRYWLLKVLFRVITPGYSKVEFIAFFVADELNSLIYTIENIYFIACAYVHKWPGNIFNVCPSGKTWPYALLLCLPALSRLIQCLKRYHDSKLYIHLINAGKYASVIIQQWLFVLWRNKGSKYNHVSFFVWIIAATTSASYTCTWDLVVDWSLFRPNSALLRKDRGYSRPFVYYIAMLTNIGVRFIYIWYIPNSHHHIRIRSFFFALAEMLRRWQWNFFRVETEHLGNADAYRVTREIPLPYRQIGHDSDDEFGDITLEKKRSRSHHPHISVNLDRLRRGARDNNPAEGRGPDALDVGPRGHFHQREYEARRPGDVEGKIPRGNAQA
ncbi:hypothetical protein L204_101913 [Cryptococcus depauperatus]